ncbi:TPA: hypothetical protein DIV48_03445 [Candidatus Kaiserbacteria bacterium]|nr:MAG: hypothetical protein UY93_C0003G0041 [Parcubacteria group bacterium GW2011_GWA1_56_13]HCR52667.1 hypothetical protein [Candidatus Kaiserbacteria bacterium]
MFPFLLGSNGGRLVASGLVQADRARNAAAPPAAVHAMAPDACIPESVLVLVLVLVLDSY